MPKQTVKMKLERETKRTYRYEEVTEGKPQIIGTLYVQQWALPEKPEQITVTIETE